MFKRYRFILALMVCLCVFSCGVIGTACAAESDVVLNTTNFDEPFLTALIPLLNAIEGISDKAKLDTGEATDNNKLTAGEIAKVTTLDLSSASNKTSITSLKGIEYFTALTTLNVTGCTGLTELDVTALTRLTSLDVSDCSALTTLKYYQQLRDILSMLPQSR